MTDLYRLLGVERGADKDAIKKAYRTLAKALHPDRHPGDKSVEDRFKQVSAAYAILSDPAMRERYDRGEIDASGQARRPDFHHQRAQAGGGFQGFAGGFKVEDILGDLFGAFGGGRRGAKGKGGDDSYSVRIGFTEAARGGTRRMTMAGGRSFDVAIPEGITDGQTIRLKGQGRPGPAGPGDALIGVTVEPHPVFSRDGDHLRMELAITLAEAVLGAKVEVPTLDGAVTMGVPAGSNSGDTLRLRGKGIGGQGRQRGDQYVRLKVMLPSHPDAELTRLVEKWSREHPYTVR